METPISAGTFNPHCGTSDSLITITGTHVESPDMERISVMIQEYRKILETRLNSETLHPWKLLDHGWDSKLRVFHFGDGTTRSEVPCLDRRNNSSHLWQDLEQSVETNKPKECHRSMILLEGVDPRIAEVLSIKLNIPPEFWIAHYHDNSNLKFLDPLGLEYSSSTYWYCDVPTRLRVDMGRKTRLERPTRFETYRGSCYRGEATLHETGILLDAQYRVSFWGQLTDNGWIGKWSSFDFLSKTDCYPGGFKVLSYWMFPLSTYFP